MARPKLINIHSTKTENGGLPTADQIEYGELAVNYATGNMKVSMRNSADAIVAINFSELADIPRVAASGLNGCWNKIDNINSILEELLYTDKTITA